MKTIDINKHRALYMGVSFFLLIASLVCIVWGMLKNENHAPLKLGIDFTGGTLLGYTFDKPLTQSDLPAVVTAFEAKGYSGTVVQLQASRQPLEKEAINGSVVSIRTKPLKTGDLEAIENTLVKRFGPMHLQSKNAIGPTLANELFTSGMLALVLACLMIVGYLTVRFQFDYALCAVLALIHDLLFVVGAFALMGVLWHVEVDSLFITAILTVLGFSVHDTIVVFDRLRENTKLLHSKKLHFSEIANISVQQTLVRSVNTSFTALLTLTALYFWGGETTRLFVLAMILGILTGTYSSIFVASMLLVWWRDRSEQAASQSLGIA